MKLNKYILILIIVLLAYAIGSGIIGVEFFPNAHAEAPRVAMKVPEQTFSNWLWWQILWWCPVVFIAAASLTGCFWLAGHARDKWRLIHPENGVFPVVQMNTASIAERLSGVKQTTFVPVSVLGQEAATVRTHQGQTQISGGRADWTSTHQLTVVQNEQKARLAAAMSGDSGIRNSAQAKLAAGYYDRPVRIVEEQQDVKQIPLNEDWEPLTVQDALAQSTDTEWVLGQNQESGELFKLNLREIVHFGIVGATGTGKTAYTAILMMANALRSRWRVIILDGKGGADWSKYSKVLEYHALDYTNVSAFIGSLTREYERRQAKLNEANANNIWELTPMPRPTMVMVDEFGAVMDSLKIANATEYKRVGLELGNLLRLSRSSGISMVFCDQDPSKWPSAMRANLPVNICFKLGGMKGNSVAEYNLNELDRTGHFQVNGGRFHAWPTYKVIDSILPGIDYKKPKALLTVDGPSAPSSVQSFSLLDEGESRPSSPPSGERLNAVNGERNDGPTDLEAMVWQWRDEHPNGTQAELRKEFADSGIEISRGHVYNCWHSWKQEAVSVNASPQRNNPTIQDLIAQYGEVHIGSERVTTAVDKTQEVKYR